MNNYISLRGFLRCQQQDSAFERVDVASDPTPETNAFLVRFWFISDPDLDHTWSRRELGNVPKVNQGCPKGGSRSDPKGDPEVDPDSMKR